MAVSPRSSKVGLAIATSSSWGTATAVGAGNGVWVIDDLKASLSMQVDEDDSAGQDFISSLQVANHNAIKAELVTLLHYNDVFQNQLWALACGTGATSTFEPATQKTGRFATIVRDKVEFISEVPSAKCTGFELSFGDNGRGIVTWMFTGTKEVVDSAINTSTQVSATTLSTSDEIKVTDFKITYEQPLDELFVNNQDYILEPEDNAYPNIEVAMTFARLDSTSEDYIGYHRDNTALKMEALLTYIGGSKSLKFEFPRLQVAEAPIEFKAGAENVQPEVVMKAYKAAAAPSGMSVTAPFRITTEGTNTTNYFA
jgi:hypothetical protein